MKEISSKDPLFGESHIREDGRHVHDMYLFQVKTPAESKGAVRFLQAGGNDSGEGRVPSAGRRQLPDGEKVGPIPRLSTAAGFRGGGLEKV